MHMSQSQAAREDAHRSEVRVCDQTPWHSVEQSVRLRYRVPGSRRRARHPRRARTVEDTRADTHRKGPSVHEALFFVAVIKVCARFFGHVLVSLTKHDVERAALHENRAPFCRQDTRRGLSLICLPRTPVKRIVRV